MELTIKIPVSQYMRQPIPPHTHMIIFPDKNQLDGESEEEQAKSESIKKLGDKLYMHKQEKKPTIKAQDLYPTDSQSKEGGDKQ